MSTYELVYDYCSDDGFTDEHGIVTTLHCTWNELQDIIKDMREVGYYNISATDITPESEEDAE